MTVERQFVVRCDIGGLGCYGFMEPFVGPVAGAVKAAIDAGWRRENVGRGADMHVEYACPNCRQIA